MLKRTLKFFAAALLLTGLVLSFSSCQSTGAAATQTATSTTTSIPPTSTATISGNPALIEVVSVRGPLNPINPGGPNVEVTLKNVSSLPVTALSASLQLNQAFNFIFDVSSAKPLLPGQTVSANLNLIGGGFASAESYPIVVNGVLQDGETFSLNMQVQIRP